MNEVVYVNRIQWENGLLIISFSSGFPALSAVLRLSTKYLVVEHLRQRLNADWPSTLYGWDLRERGATDEYGRYLPREFCPHPISVIELALDMNLPSILPAALYDLSDVGSESTGGCVESDAQMVWFGRGRNADLFPGS